MKLSDTALVILNGAAQRDDGLVPRRAKVPPAVDANVCRSLERNKLVKRIREPRGASGLFTVQGEDDGGRWAFRITALGRNEIRVEPEQETATAPAYRSIRWRHSAPP